jgi:hypothetical protein
MGDTSSIVGAAPSWVRDYGPLAASTATLIVCVAGFWIMRRKNTWDLRKAQVDTHKGLLDIGKTELEIAKLKRDMGLLSDIADTNAANISEIQARIGRGIVYPDEHVVYENTSGSLGFDFRGRGGRKSPSDGMGSGSVTFENGIITITRDNIEGRYEIFL